MARKRSLKLFSLSLGLAWPNAPIKAQPGGPVSQVVPETRGLCTNKTYYDTQSKRLFVPSSMPLKLLLQTGKEAGSLFSLDKTADKAESFLNFPEGEHLLTVSSTIKQIYRIVGDANPPETRTSLTEVPSIQKSGMTYYGRGFEIDLEPTDTVSGVEALHLSLNESGFKPEKQRKFRFSENGSFRLMYFACDRVGNREPIHRLDFKVDVREPTSTLSLKSNIDRRYLGPGALIAIKAEDAGIGVGATYFSFDGQKFQTYDREISVAELKQGPHTLTYYSEDALNNKEPVQSYSFHYDAAVPRLDLKFIGKQWQDGDLLYLNREAVAQIVAEDRDSGIHMSRITIDDKNLTLQDNKLTLSIAEGPHSIRVEATDLAGNTSFLDRKVHIDAEAPRVKLELLTAATRLEKFVNVMSPLKFKLQAFDSGAGVKSLEYCINDLPCQPYRDGVEILEAGDYTIRYFARDRLDQVSPVLSQNFRIQAGFGQRDAQPINEIRRWVADDNSGAIGPEGKLFRLEIADGPGEDAQRFAIGVPMDALKSVPADAQGIRKLVLKMAKFAAEIKIPFDSRSPASKHSFRKAPEAEAQGKRFFGKGLVLPLEAVDPQEGQASGLRSIYYSLNGAAFSPYVRPLQQFDAEQDYQLKYYSVDRVGNREAEQEVGFSIDLTPPQTHVAIEGRAHRQYLSREARLRLNAEDLLSQPKLTYFAFDEAPFQVYDADKIDSVLTQLKNGPHRLRYYSEDKVMNREVEQSYAFYVDDDAPKLSHLILGPSYQVGDNLFINRGARLVLKGLDSGSGLSQVSYKLNDKNREVYTGPLELQEVTEDLSMEYTASDRVNNQSKATRLTLKLDTTPPASQLGFEGPHYIIENKINLKSNSRIVINGADTGSGLLQIFYRINSNDFISYQKPLQFPAKTESLLTVYATDRVGNREIPRTYRIVVDDEKPSLEVKTHDGLLLSSERIYPKDTLLYISAFDSQAGIKEIYYRLGQGPLKLYRRPFSVSEVGEHKLQVIAKDWMGAEDRKTLTYKVEP